MMVMFHGVKLHNFLNTEYMEGTVFYVFWKWKNKKRGGH